VTSAAATALAPPVRSRGLTKTARKAGPSVVLGLIGIAFALPLVWLIFAAVDSQASWAVEIPHWTIANFEAVTSASDLRSLGNSLLISALATGIATAVAFPAAFGLSRYNIPMKQVLVIALLFMTAIPVAVLIIPVYQIYSDIGWTGSILAASLFIGVTGLPFEVAIIKDSVDAIPRDFEEAAALDRATTWKTLIYIIWPLAAPAAAAAAIFGFINAWSMFIVPLILLTSPSDTVAPITIYGFMGSAVVRYGEIAAFSFLYALPPVLLYFFMARLFRGGFAFGGGVR
jgi:multiple sugar transport system permease protein